MRTTGKNAKESNLQQQKTKPTVSCNIQPGNGLGLFWHEITVGQPMYTNQMDFVDETAVRLGVKMAI